MIDQRVRPVANHVLRPLAARLLHVPPLAITAIAALFGIAAAITVALGLHWVALGCWIANRALDGLDGAVARGAGTASDLGGYLDMLLDTAVYAAIPIGIAVHVSTTTTWVTCAVLLATYYVNTISWTYLAALLEKRGAGARTTGEHTSITMPSGLVEGTETVVVYVVLLAFPGIAPWTFSAFAIGVAMTALQRVIWAKRHLA
ncbi:MAG: CDP-alcohol phosphatidyltransferase family protein [Acidimicrobiia bacterium]